MVAFTIETMHGSLDSASRRPSASFLFWKLWNFPGFDVSMSAGFLDVLESLKSSKKRCREKYVHIHTFHGFKKYCLSSEIYLIEIWGNSAQIGHQILTKI